ncbi:hypothetical protein ACGFH8_11845 [Micromonospora sp. NPDC049175]|uniref:hypothetical protein n=1 Tax=Micromonospora sp. NPDC049175 TaxID=3364266 RepID=UPI003721FBAE
MPNPPKFDPQRGTRGRGGVALPAGGRHGDPPPWPLPGRQSLDERRAWEQLWATPQAVAWEQLRWTRTVARYCRVMIAAEQPDASAALLAQATVLEDRLGLTPKSMRLLLWHVAADEVGERRQVPRDVRGRIRALGKEA